MIYSKKRHKMKLKSFYTHRVLTPNILFAQLKVHSLGFNRTEAVISIGTLPAQKKTELFFLLQNQIYIAVNP